MMMNNSFIKFILLIIALISLVGLFITQYQLRNRNHQLSKALTSLENSVNQTNLLKTNYYQSVAGKGKININANLYTPTNDTLSFSSLSKPHIILRYTEKACSGCNRNVLYEFLRHTSRFSPKSDICILVPKGRVKYFYREVRLRRSNINVYGISTADISCALESNDLPYLFLLNGTNIMSNIFAPSQNEISWIKEYLKALTSTGVVLNETGIATKQ